MDVLAAVRGRESIALSVVSERWFMVEQKCLFCIETGYCMNILVIDRAPPYDLLQGNALIGQHLFRKLRHHHLTLICPAPSDKLEYYHAELAGLFDTVHL